MWTCTTENGATIGSWIYGDLSLHDCESLFPDYPDNHIDCGNDYS